MTPSSQLSTITDKRYAIRIAISRACETIEADVWEWDDEKIERMYGNLRDGRLTLDWGLKHPDDIEPIE